MGIHLFNPSDPHAHDSRRCGNCRAGVPPYWKLIIEYHAEIGDITEGGIILERQRVSSNPLASVNRPCAWTPISEQPDYPGLLRSWRLEFQPTLAFSNAPNAPLDTWPYWAIWIPDRSAFSDHFDVFYSESPSPAQVEIFNITEPEQVGHFQCFGRNHFYLLDQSTDNTWPERLTVEPWYP